MFCSIRRVCRPSRGAIGAGTAWQTLAVFEAQNRMFVRGASVAQKIASGIFRPFFERFIGFSHLTLLESAAQRSETGQNSDDFDIRMVLKAGVRGELTKPYQQDLRAIYDQYTAAILALGREPSPFDRTCNFRRVLSFGFRTGK